MRITLYLLISIFSISLYSEGVQNKQSKYRPGGIISLNNDTILANIKLESIYDLQNKINFIDAGGKKKSFKPDIINGFYFDTEDGKMIFESRDDVQISALPSKRGYFVNRISNDICPLYYFVTRKMINLGVESKLITIPYYLIHKNNSWHYINTESFGDCVKIFRDYDVMVKDIKDDKYTFDDIPNMVEKYCQFVKNR